MANELQGVEQMRRVLRAMPKEVAKRDIDSIVRAGANVARRSVRERVPRDVDPSGAAEKYGSLFKNIRVTKWREGLRRNKIPPPGPDEVTMIVHTGNAFWGLFFEYGTGPRKAKEKEVLANPETGEVFGVEVAPIAPRPFFFPGIDAAMASSFARMNRIAAKRIEKTASELAGRFGSISKSTKRRL